jgi:hypothetical protein
MIPFEELSAALDAFAAGRPMPAAAAPSMPAAAPAPMPQDNTAETEISVQASEPIAEMPSSEIEIGDMEEESH